MTWKRISHQLRCCAVALLAAGCLAASEHHGTVKFGGLPVPGATVTAAQGDKKFIAVTSDQGTYSFPDLADGIWSIEVEMLCFSPIKRDVGIAPDAASPEWELKLLPFAEIQAAAGPAPPPAAPATQSAPVTASTAASPKTAAAAPPAKGKPGAATPASKTPQAGFQRADLNASADAAKPAAEDIAAAAATDPGQSASAFVVNGSVNNGASSAFGQSPAFGNGRKGRGSGYNGTAGFVMDNSLLDARTFSLTGQATPKPAYNHLAGTLSFGGPLRIPHLRFQQPPNFFIGYQLVRNRNASLSSVLVPTALERSGDFSQTLSPSSGQPVQIFDPNTGLPFFGNVIPGNRISSQATALLRFYPMPNFNADSRYNYQIPIVGRVSSDSVQARVNKSIDRKNQMNGSIAYQRSNSLSPNLFGFRDTTDSSGLNTTLNWSHRFSQRVFMNFSLNFSRAATRLTPNFANIENVSGEAGITGNNQEPINWGPPNLNFSSVAGLSDQSQSFTRNQTAGLAYQGFWNRAPHNFTYGADIRKQEFNILAQSNARGNFTFTGASTQANANGVPVQGTGSDLAGFLLGIPDASSLAFGNADKYLRASIYDAYINDDWRVRPGFTLNLGVRWDYNAPITELYGRLVNLDIAPGFGPVQPVVAYNPTGALTGQRYSDSLVKPDKHEFAPSIGIAWHPLLGSSMVVRAGYGVNYDTSVYQSIAVRMDQQSPLSKSLSVQNTPANPLTLANGFNASPSITLNTFAIDPNFKIGYVQSWQASIQRDLPAGMMMTATYLGIKGTRAQQVFLPNTYPLGVQNPCAACASGYAYLTSNGNSTREAGQFNIRRRLHNGFTASAQYTFSKAMDDAALGGRGQGGSVIAQNWLNLAGERGLSNFDQRHLLAATLQYTSGMGVRGGTLLSGWRGALLKRWTFVTAINAGTGFPMTPVYTAVTVGTGVTGTIRPNYTGLSLYDAPDGFFLNRFALTQPVAGQWGNAGRNSITGPKQFTLNSSMARSFVEGKIDLRIDAINPLNHVTFPSWNTNISSQQFGLPSFANGMRVLQVNLRWRFL